MVCGVFWLVPGGGSCESRDAIQGCRATIQEMQAKWGAHFMLRPTILLLFFLQGDFLSCAAPPACFFSSCRGDFLSCTAPPACFFSSYRGAFLSCTAPPACFFSSCRGAPLLCAAPPACFFSSYRGGLSLLYCPTCTLLFFLQGGFSFLCCPTCMLLFFLRGASPNFCPNATCFKQQKTILHPTKPIKCAHWMQYRLLSRRIKLNQNA